jgi:hypothetical protein
MTYFEENKLVDEDFPEDCSPQKVKELLAFLSEPEILAKESNMHPKVSSAFSSDDGTLSYCPAAAALLFRLCLLWWAYH